MKFTGLGFMIMSLNQYKAYHMTTFIKKLQFQGIQYFLKPAQKIELNIKNSNKDQTTLLKYGAVKMNVLNHELYHLLTVKLKLFFGVDPNYYQQV